MSEALRDARTAEAAAAEDFDPLRIRPYVELERDSAAETMQLRPIEPRRPAPLASAATTPNAQDLSLFEPATRTAGAPDDEDDLADGDEIRSGASRHRRTVLLGVGGALVAVMTAAGLASGVFSYEAPTRKTALPDDVRASVPAPSTSEASEPTATTTPSTPPPTSASASASPTQSPTSSPSPSRSTASPTASPSTEPTTTPSATEPTDSQADDSPAERDPAPETLRRGDRGPEVTELELRLTQLGLYTRQARGNYNEGVEDAVTRYQWARGVQPEDYGVYDLETRQRLESETNEP
ncbi:peptidoglycan-binding domain-containing protein [Streptomyces sp. NPDC056464]|uniref:peptidoglycan-binding domain-containing protein n=1 Tax=Streptomyces sp. NPDC056464 TaxID=3345828 RepID=UPI00369E83BD